MNFSSMSVEERIKYDDSIQSAIPLIDEFAERIQKLESELEKDRKNQEIIEEQLYFARELIEAIQDHCKHYTRANELKKAISNSIENSYLEL